MNLVKFLESFPNVAFLKESDEEKYRCFFETQKMETSDFDLSINLKRDYLFNQENEDKRYTIVYWEKEEIVVSGTIVVRKEFILGEERTLGYLCELRVRPRERRGLLCFREVYSSLIKEKNNIEELKEIERFYSIVLSKNEKALKFFSRKLNDIKYEKHFDFKSYHYFFPFFSLKNRRYSCELNGKEIEVFNKGIKVGSLHVAHNEKNTMQFKAKSFRSKALSFIYFKIFKKRKKDQISQIYIERFECINGSARSEIFKTGVNFIFKVFPENNVVSSLEVMEDIPENIFTNKVISNFYEVRKEKSAGAKFFKEMPLKLSWM